ncbi:MAG: hypothetical protein ACK4NO_00920 [Glycocaulis sp.]
MNTKPESAAADLAYLREMAEAGANAPLLGGRFMVWWGGLTGFTFLAHWAIIMEYAPLGWNMLLPLWIGFMLVGSAGQAVLAWSVRNKPGAGSIGNRAQSIVWPAIGTAMMAYFLGIVAGVILGGLPPVFFNSMLAVGFLGYGAGWMIDGLISRQRLMLVPAVISFVCVFVCAAMIMSAHAYLVAAAGMIIGTFLPGALMMFKEPRSQV